MKFEINTTGKTITLLEECSIKEITEFIGKDWKEWKIRAMEVGKTIRENWIITQPNTTQFRHPYYPNGDAQIICTDDIINSSKNRVTV